MKTRKTKLREERRDELIDTAERLFVEHGYDETSVSDIVKSLDIAQGTFYYHFKSKEDILEAIVQRAASHLESQLREVIGRAGPDSAARLRQAIDLLFQESESHRGVLEYAHRDANVVLHHKLTKSTVERITRLVTELIEAGVAEGHFDVAYPVEAAEILVAVMNHVFHQSAVMNDPQRSAHMRQTLEQLLERLLAPRANSAG